MKYYKIYEEELLQLLNDSAWLNALDNAGVDNWEGCSYASEDFEESDEVYGYEEVK